MQIIQTKFLFEFSHFYQKFQQVFYKSNGSFWLELNFLWLVLARAKYFWKPILAKDTDSARAGILLACSTSTHNKNVPLKVSEYWKYNTLFYFIDWLEIFWWSI